MLDLYKIFSGKQFVLASLALILTVVISLSLHEFAHAFAAHKQGDQTAKALGRLTLNPAAHVDPLGLACLMLFGIGWAKPVPINPVRFRNYKKGLVIVSLAGVTVNLILAFIFGGAYVAFDLFVVADTLVLFFIYMFFYLMFSINAMLFVFNLLPIAPLDGYNLISAVTKYDNKFVMFMNRYGTIVLFLLVFIFSWILTFLVQILTFPITSFWTWIFTL